MIPESADVTQPARPDAASVLPEAAFADDGTDLMLILWSLSLTPLQRLQVFEAWMADVVVMLGAANRPKDLAALPALRQTLEESRRRGG